MECCWSYAGDSRNGPEERGASGGESCSGAAARGASGGVAIASDGDPRDPVVGEAGSSAWGAADSTIQPPFIPTGARAVRGAKKTLWAASVASAKASVAPAPAAVA